MNNVIILTGNIIRFVGIRFFGRDNLCNICKLNDINFKDDIIRLCKLYEINYNRIYRLSHDDISKPDFMGIDNRWNPYAY